MAIMRALGARRSHVLAIVLIEAVLLAVGGGLAGWMLGHLLVGAIAPLITTNAGVSASVLSAAPGAELLLVPFLVVLAILAGVVLFGINQAQNYFISLTPTATATPTITPTSQPTYTRSASSPAIKTPPLQPKSLSFAPAPGLPAGPRRRRLLGR